jgi:aldehyde:ferredoxin oxidoreductase
MKEHTFQDILVVDLTTGGIDRMPVTERLARDFIGGQGIGSYLLTQFVKPGADPLGPDNALILSPGQLVGTAVPSASRSTFLAGSPTIGGYLGMSNGGGMMQLRNAGFDHLVVLGQSPRPVYLKITDDQVTILDAHHLWGKDTVETAQAIWMDFGDHFEVAAIGPAGENLVRHAAIVGNGYIAWGRTGLGAVMGSKNLKAIAVHGSRPVPTAHPTKLLKLAKTTTQDMVGQDEAIQVWRDGGTWKWAKTSPKPTRNLNSDLWDLDKYDQKFEHHPVACPGCPVGCKHALKIKPGHKYEGLELTVGCTYATMNGPFGLGLGLTHFEEMMKCGDWVQRLGMDSEVTAGVISLLIEMYEHGLISGQETGGLELQWGDEALTVKLMHIMARREGSLGDLMAEGTAHMAKTIGNGAERFLVNFKGMGKALTAHSGGDSRVGLTTQSLSWALNFRGHGDRHRYPFLGNRVDQKKNNIDSLFDLASHLGIPDGKLQEIGREPEMITPWAMRYVQDYNTVAYALGFCDRPVVLNVLPIDRMTDLYNAAMGTDRTSTELLQAGRRIWNLEKAWVTMQGQTRADDYPPDRFFEETMDFKPTWPPDAEEKTYSSLDRGIYEQILHRYYQSQGWDTVTGLPTPDTLREVGLEWLLAEYEEHMKSSTIST